MRFKPGSLFWKFSRREKVLFFMAAFGMMAFGGLRYSGFPRFFSLATPFHLGRLKIQLAEDRERILAADQFPQAEFWSLWQTFQDTSSKIDPSGKLSQLIREKAEQFNLRVNDVHAEETRQTAEGQIASVSFVLEGEYSDLVRLFEILENPPYFLRLRECRLERQSSSAAPLRFSGKLLKLLLF